MHEDNFLSCWLRCDTEGEVEAKERDRKDKEEVSKSGTRGGGMRPPIRKKVVWPLLCGRWMV